MTDRFAGSLGLQLGKTIDLGIVTIGARITLPLVDFVSANSQAGARNRGAASSPGR